MATKARQQYHADETTLSKERREFSISDDVQEKIDSIEEGAQVNTIETIKVNGNEVQPDENKAIDLTIPGVVDSLSSTSITDALSARQGKILYDKIDNVSRIGHFLALWDASTGLPVTDPEVSPYEYNAGDFYTISVVATGGGTNYKPSGTEYVSGQASTDVETGGIAINDFYFYDGTTWRHMKNSGAGNVVVDGSLSTTSTNPVENRVVTNALSGKQNTLTAGTNIQINGNTISATDTKYTAGTGISIANGVISNTQTSAEWGNITGTLSDQTDLQTVLTSKATDADVVHKTGAETITGVKTFGTTNTFTFDGTNATVYSPTANGYFFVTRGGTVPVTMAIKSGTSGGTFGTTTNHQFQFRTNDKMRMQVDSEANGGKVKLATTSIPAVGDDSEYVPSTSWVNTAIANGIVGKQDTLTAGTNITISGNTISATDTTYNAGEGIAIGTYDDYSAMRGPCPVGFHIPTTSEWVALGNILKNTFGMESKAVTVNTYLKIPSAGKRDSSSSNVSVQGLNGFYRSCIDYYQSTALYVFFNGTQLFRNEQSNKGHGVSIRGFKDSPVMPDSSWVTLYDGSNVATGAGIFHNAASGLISISADGINWTTIADKNVGATTVYNTGDTLSEANCGGYFQRGNNYMFPRTGTVNTSSTQVDASNYGPGNYYSSSTFIIGSDWTSVRNNDLRGGETGVVTLNNAISNTGVLSVNGQTGDVTIDAGEASSITTVQPSNPVEGDIYYDTTNDVVKVYDGTNWNVVGDDSADINTKTFFFSGNLMSQSNLETALSIIDWLYDGDMPSSWSRPIDKNPIVVYNDGNGIYNKAFHLEGIYDYSGGLHMAFERTMGYADDYHLGEIEHEDITLSITGHSTDNIALYYHSNYKNFLSTTNTISYTPTADYNPATKKYVDDTVASAKSSGATAPSNPVEGQLWYDTTNDVLKVYNGTTWVEVGGGITNDTTGTTSTISQEWVGTKAEFNALSSYGNKIYNIIE